MHEKNFEKEWFELIIQFDLQKFAEFEFIWFNCLDCLISWITMKWIINGRRLDCIFKLPWDDICCDLVLYK